MRSEDIYSDTFGEQQTAMISGWTIVAWPG
jgi:hypothetical protein